MNLETLINCLHVEKVRNSVKQNITGIAYNSKQVNKGNIIVAIEGL